MDFIEEVVFSVHDKVHTIKDSSNLGPDISLNEYLRSEDGLTGTKNMCLEGGCGACIVSVTVKHPVTKQDRTFAVNSCLIPVLLCHGWNIQTTEGIGNRKIGYHPIQTTLTKFNGTQCGYCSGGMVMNMYALYQSKQHSLTKEEIENAFGGNLCRCTGYRSIMDAFKSMAVDADKSLIEKYPDIEDIKICSKTGKQCSGSCDLKHLANQPVCLDLSKSKWYKLYTMENVIRFLNIVGESTYSFVGGGTGKGVYKTKKIADFYADLTAVPDLVSYKLDTNLVFGANVSLTDAMEAMTTFGKENTDFWYLNKVYEHFHVIANVPVRNAGTLAGNLSLKHDHHDFPSDVFTLFEACNTKVTIVESTNKERTMSPLEYLNYNMKKCFMKTISLPPLKKSQYIFESYKITPRLQNAHAYVNAAFLIELSNDKVKSANLVYGGINADFTHATNTENYLVGKALFDNTTLKGAIEQLNTEIKPDFVLPDASPEFRKTLSQALFYKMILKNAPKDKLSPKNQSGGNRLERPLSSGVQDFTTNKDLYPVNKPIPKLEALVQCSGEAQYIMDIPQFPGELAGALVLAETTPLSKIKNIDASEAMKMPGVVAFYSSKDIPGSNSYTPPMFPTVEELFCSGKVQFNGQPVGIIVANSHQQAVNAAPYVHITYEKTNDVPAYTIKDVLKNNLTSRIKNVVDIPAKNKGNDIKHVIKGTFDIGGQYHFTMETLCAICVPIEDGFDIYAATQYLDHVQMCASQSINVPQNKINVYVRRIGGGYGAKIMRTSQISTAAAVAAQKLNKPVRISLPLVDNMKAIGKRQPTSALYEAGIDNDGKIQYLNYTVYKDYGTSGNNENVSHTINGYFINSYNADSWSFKVNNVQTDMVGYCSTRAPGGCEGVAMIEEIMDHIAVTVNKDPIQIRMNNLLSTRKDTEEIIKELRNWADYDKRKQAIDEFNNKNRWIKKGITFVIMNYPFEIWGQFSVMVSIFAGDGTVSVSHGGVECGQGINTKVAQVCAYTLKIPLEKVTIKPTNSFNCPNNTPTGGSITSEACSYAVIQACNTILNRLQPIKEKMKNPTWEQLIKEAQAQDVELVATHMFHKNSGVQPYNILGVCIVEVEVDILTGEHTIPRVDLIEDSGSSLSPEVDIGQIEGAFVMGLGYWTCENLIYGKDGELLTNSTWTYKIPGVKEIPTNFRIQLKKNSKNPNGVLNSKATGEPPLCLSVGVPLAIRRALASARADADSKVEKWTPIDGPTTVEYKFQNSMTKPQTFAL